jgi:hypothetical protein
MSTTVHMYGLVGPERGLLIIHAKRGGDLRRRPTCQFLRAFKRCCHEGFVSWVAKPGAIEAIPETLGANKREFHGGLMHSAVFASKTSCMGEAWAVADSHDCAGCNRLLPLHRIEDL